MRRQREQEIAGASEKYENLQRSYKALQEESKADNDWQKAELKRELDTLHIYA